MTIPTDMCRRSKPLVGPYRSRALGILPPTPTPTHATCFEQAALYHALVSYLMTVFDPAFVSLEVKYLINNYISNDFYTLVCLQHQTRSASDGHLQWYTNLVPTLLSIHRLLELKVIY
jgi:hypothetical protein